MTDTTRNLAIAEGIRAAHKWLIWAGIAAMLLPGLALAQIPDLKITHYQLVSSKRINATLFEYQYRVSATNSGAAAQQVTASVSPSSTSTQVVDGGVSFGTVQAGQTVASSDTIKLRQDRRFGLNAANLHWHFRLVTLPVRLDGAPTAAAVASTRDFYNGDIVPASEMTTHPDYGPVARTKLTVIFHETATTQQVNDLLDSLHGGITSMLVGSPTFGLRIPDPGSVSALDGIIATAKNRPGVEDVFPATASQPKLLPDNPGLGSNPQALWDLAIIEHHLAAKAYGLWNARKGFNDRSWAKPTVLIADVFGSGPPSGPAWGFTIPDPADFKTSFADMHGYFVASVIGAAFGGTGDTTDDQVTGLAPGAVELRAIDLAGPVTMVWDLTADIIDRTKHSGAPTHVINISLGDCLTASICSSAAWNHLTDFLGKQIVKAVRTAGIENKAVFVLAAGNDAIPAHLEGGSQRAFIGPFSDPAILPLTNGLVVENFKYVHASGTDITAGVGCRASDSCYGGNIGGFGDLIWGYDNVSGHSIVRGGTSFAAPQIAAVAHFVWTMADPTLTAPQIVDRIIASGYSKTGCGSGDGLVVDAYAAALTADTEIKIGRAPVRETILDVANDQDQDIPDGKFDHHDIKRFLKAFSDATSAASANSGNYIADYSRYDLNGDGYTAGSASSYAGRFKLEEPFPASYTRPSPLSYGTVTQNIEGVPVSFSENSLTDLEILAYYAYSPLFVSTPESQFERAMLFLPYADKLHIELNRVLITWKPSFQAPSGWTAAPTVELFSLNAPAPTFSGSNFMMERGVPLYSYQVAPTSTYYAANDTSGVPYLQYPNRLPASSFFAYSASGQVWINATTRYYRISELGIVEREYQSRFFLDVPTASGRSKSVKIGSVPGDNNFNVAQTLTGEYFDVALKFVAAP